jgi:4-hydroxybenzoate polyprenyltransferase
MTKIKYYIRSIRWFEIAVRIGAPVFAILLVIPFFRLSTMLRAGHAIIAFFFLWAHGYSYNEWGGYYTDKIDNRKSTPLITGALSRLEIFRFSIILGALSLVLYLFLDSRFLIIAIFDIIVGICYVHPRILLKHIPLVSYLIMCIISITDFLLGWCVFSSQIGNGILIGIFFGLLGIVGQKYHEAGDADADARAHIKTNAVRFGKKKIFLSAFIFYTISVAYFIILTILKIIPDLLWPVLVVIYPLYVFFFYRAWKSGLDTDTVHHFILQYRILYGIIGLYFIIRLLIR